MRSVERNERKFVDRGHTHWYLVCFRAQNLGTDTEFFLLTYLQNDFGSVKTITMDPDVMIIQNKVAENMLGLTSNSPQANPPDSGLIFIYYNNIEQKL